MLWRPIPDQNKNTIILFCSRRAVVTWQCRDGSWQSATGGGSASQGLLSLSRYSLSENSFTAAAAAAAAADRRSLGLYSGKKLGVD